MSHVLTFGDGEQHWLTLFDPDDGEPYEIPCTCSIGEDHDGKGNLMPS